MCFKIRFYLFPRCCPIQFQTCQAGLKTVNYKISMQGEARKMMLRYSAMLHKYLIMKGCARNGAKELRITNYELRTTVHGQETGIPPCFLNQDKGCPALKTEPAPSFFDRIPFLLPHAQTVFHEDRIFVSEFVQSPGRQRRPVFKYSVDDDLRVFIGDPVFDQKLEQSPGDIHGAR